MTHSIAYDPLPSGTIRLLKLQENLANECVGNLELFELDRPPPYYTLSYCWGKGPETMPLPLQTGTLWINSNLAAAIQNLRRLGSSDTTEVHFVQYVWIDRICINQEDVLERSAQVARMNQIFSNSIRTLIWIGSNIGRCTDVWPLIRRIYDVCMDHNPGVESIIDIPSKLYSERHHIASGLPPLTHKQWDSLSALLSDPWFTRVGVIQEVVLSPADPIVLHGQRQFSWRYLGWAATWMRRNGYLRLHQFPESLRNIDEISNIRRSIRRWPLDALLGATSIKFHATDQRDKVYAVLGIAAEVPNSSNEPLLRSDYSLSIEEVYLRTAWYLIRATRSLATIIRTKNTSLGQSQRIFDMAHLPSWVPDWSDFASFDRDITKAFSWIAYPKTSGSAILGFPNHCEASAGRPLAILEPAHRNETMLRLVGVRTDVILHCLRFNDTNQLSKRFIDSFDAISIQILDRIIPLIARRGLITWLTDYVKATTAEQYDLGGRRMDLLLKDGAAYVSGLLSISDMLRSRFISQSIEKSPINKLRDLSFGGKASMYAALAQNFCYGRALVITSQGRMGLAFGNTQIGDVVSILYGGGVPYILRKHTNHWEFLGDSYFPGLTRGEGIRAQGNKSIEEVDFYIR